MYKLYLDTSTFFLCIGVEKDNVFIHKLQILAEKKQSEITISNLDLILKKLNITLQDINEVIVTYGPGSYTGIRIGLCIAKVIASMQGIPLKVVSSLNAFANNNKQIVLLDAKGDRSYIGIYDNHQNLISENVMSNSDIEVLLQYYQNYDVFKVDLFKENLPIDILENMRFIANTLNPVSDVDAVIPVCLKER